MVLSPSSSIIQINECWRLLALYTRVGLIDARALRDGWMEFRGIPSSHPSPLLHQLTNCYRLIIRNIHSGVIDPLWLKDLLDELIDEQDAYLSVNGDPAETAADAAAAVAAYVRAAAEEAEDEEEEEIPLWMEPLAM